MIPRFGGSQSCEDFLAKWIRVTDFQTESSSLFLKRMDTYLFLGETCVFGDVHIPYFRCCIFGGHRHTPKIGLAFRLRLHPCMGRLPRAFLSQDSPVADTSTWVQRAKKSKPSDMKSLMVIWVPSPGLVGSRKLT